MGSRGGGGCGCMNGNSKTIKKVGLARMVGWEWREFIRVTSGRTTFSVTPYQVQAKVPKRKSKAGSQFVTQS